MAKLKAVSYEEQRADHFRELMKKAQRKIDWWQAAGRSLNRSYDSRWHNECSEAGIQYNFYKDALEALETAQPKWISVEDRLPEEGDEVLVYFDGVIAKSEIIMFDMITKYPMWSYTGAGGDPTHWMPLPEPPKED